MPRLPIHPKLFSFIRNLTSNSIPDYRYRTPTQLAPESNTFSQDSAPVNGGTPRKVSEVKEVRDLLFFPYFVENCRELLRYKSIILSVDKPIMALKIRVAVTVFR